MKWRVTGTPVLKLYHHATPLRIRRPLWDDNDVCTYHIFIIITIITMITIITITIMIVKNNHFRFSRFSRFTFLVSLFSLCFSLYYSSLFILTNCCFVQLLDLQRRKTYVLYWCLFSIAICYLIHIHLKYTVRVFMYCYISCQISSEQHETPSIVDNVSSALTSDPFLPSFLDFWSFPPFLFSFLILLAFHH